MPRGVATTGGKVNVVRGAGELSVRYDDEWGRFKMSRERDRVWNGERARERGGGLYEGCHRLAFA